MSLTPQSKSVTFTATPTLVAQVINNVRKIEIYPQDTARKILQELGFSDSAYDLISPKNGNPYSENALPFNDFADGGAVTVVASRRNSPS